MKPVTGALLDVMTVFGIASLTGFELRMRYRLIAYNHCKLRKCKKQASGEVRASARFCDGVRRIRSSRHCENFEGFRLFVSSRHASKPRTRQSLILILESRGQRRL
ncbi:hypothetical protein [Bradyrhizobium retamae]|uniref:hypothetical protein n=1 Tax=Bradyrhizobium retamae TaxID=1300035 RepID=UPI000A844EF6|nr:hypothetical protein [Bradyrhizobium retamae]